MVLCCMCRLSHLRSPSIVFEGFLLVVNFHRFLEASWLWRNFSGPDFWPDFCGGLIFYTIFGRAGFRMVSNRPWCSIDVSHVLNLCRFFTTSDPRGNFTCSTFGPDFFWGWYFLHIFRMCRFSRHFSPSMIVDWVFTCAEFGLFFSSIRFSMKFYLFGFRTIFSGGLIFYWFLACADFDMNFQRPWFSIDFWHLLNLLGVLAAPVFQWNCSWSDFWPIFSVGFNFYRFFACAHFVMIFHRPWNSMDFLHSLNLHRLFASSNSPHTFLCVKNREIFFGDWFSAAFMPVQIFIWFFTVHDFPSIFQCAQSASSFACVRFST